MAVRKYPKYLTCEYCNKAYFARKPSPRGDGVLRKYCSMSCMRAAEHIEPIPCPNCRTVFTPRVKQGVRQRYCSIKCRAQYQRMTLPKVVCEKCNKEFSVYPSRFKQGTPRYCSQECANNKKKWEKEQFKRLKTPSWIETRKQVLKRDGRKCASCGSTEKLIVHHIVRWIFTKNDSLSNLITLCRSCHTAIEWNGVECPSPPQ